MGYSRVQKYENLRNKLQNNSDVKSSTDISSEVIKSVTNRINNDVIVEDHDPIHAKREEYLSNTANILKPKISTVTSNFDNEYLDEYINEVKQYNKEKGNTVSEDTTQNILNNLYDIKPDVTDDHLEVKNINPYKNLSDDELEKTRNDIALEVKNLINNKPIFETEDEEVEEENISTTSKQNLNIIKDEYDDDLDDYDDKPSSTNRILNFALVVLILACLVVIAVLIYWILLNKGII